MNTKFSVAMCVYGKDDPAWFAAAVESILNQTASPSEVVLVVDGPVPNELNQVVLGYEKQPVFKVIRFKENKGHGLARKAALGECSNELVALMDSDDISQKDRFEKQLLAFKNHPTADVIGGQIAEFINEENNIVGTRVVPLTDTEIKSFLKTRCPMNLVTVMFKKTAVEKVGGFLDWYCEEDYYLWVRMALANMRFANVNAVLVKVRVGKEMYSRRGGIKYFKSEAKLQKYLLRHKLITPPRYFVNVAERLVLQVLMPNRLRRFVFQKFARK